MHDTLMLTSRIGSLDMPSGGRTIIGMGVGWKAAELSNHGVDSPPATKSCASRRSR